MKYLAIPNNPCVEVAAEIDYHVQVVLALVQNDLKTNNAGKIKALKAAASLADFVWGDGRKALKVDFLEPEPIKKLSQDDIK